MAQVSLLKPSEGIIQDVHDKLQAELTKRFGQIQYVTPLAISTLLDPRFKNLHFNDTNACSRAMSRLRYLIRNDTSSRESEEAPPESTYNFWATLKELVQSQGHKKKKKSHGNAGNDLSLYLSNPVMLLLCITV